VHRKPTVERQEVDDAETTNNWRLENMRMAGKAGLKMRKPEKTFQDLCYPIGDSRSNRTSADDEEAVKNKEDYEEDTIVGKLSQDDEPGWVIGTISKMVHCASESCSRSRFGLSN
jgi:hypothetical protein